MMELAIALLIGLVSGYNINTYQSDLEDESLRRVCVSKDANYFVYRGHLYKCNEYRLLDGPPPLDSPYINYGRIRHR